MTDRAPQLHLAWVWLIMATLPTVLMLSGIEVLGAWQWADSGQCPGMAPDIPPEPCTLWQYVHRDWGAFATMALAFYVVEMLLLSTWVVLGWWGDRWLRGRFPVLRVIWLVVFALPVVLGFVTQWALYGWLAAFFTGPPVLVLAVLRGR